tara:strand:- start:5022 stop:5987 length:966 start_codon:yes stop_codon:yes gene_type:complete
MAFANYNPNTYRVGKSGNVKIKTIMDKFRHLASNKMHLCKKWINGSRYILFYGNNKIINAVQDWYIATEAQVPKGIVIDLQKNIMTIYDAELLQRGAQAFGNEFHDNINIKYHWGTRAMYEGTKHEIKSTKSCNELVNKQNPEDKYVFLGMKIDLNTYKVLNKPPKEIKNNVDNWINAYKLQRNARARARAQNNNALTRLNKFRNTGCINDLDMKDAFRLFNVSERREVIAAFGMDTILANCESRVLDKHSVDNRPYEVVEVKVEDATFPDRYRWCNYLRMVNPSTSEIHFEGIPNTENTVIDALKWRDGETDYVKPIVLT